MLEWRAVFVIFAMTAVKAVKIAVAQTNPLVGDLIGNAERALDMVLQARAGGAALTVFPELAISGYGVGDLVRHGAFGARLDDAMELLRSGAPDDMAVLMGCPHFSRPDAPPHNSAALLLGGRWRRRFHKRCLANHGVFDERRHFAPGRGGRLFELAGLRLGVLICEDVWHDGQVAQLARHSPDLLVCMSASPFRRGKHQVRCAHLAAVARHHGRPVLYVNQVGGQDSLVFDGASLMVDGGGRIVFQAPQFVDGLFFAQAHRPAPGRMAVQAQCAALDDEPEVLWQALRLGLCDYVRKNGFEELVLGLSGGVDSALCLALAVDALGPRRVVAMSLPSVHTSDASRRLAREQAAALGVAIEECSIAPLMDAACASLGMEDDGSLAAQNLQARIRCMMLMARANQGRRLLMATGNKSEMAVGYATLYGDMAGGFAPLKDVDKQLVYELARMRGLLPEIIERTPTAELAEGQKDSDSLPPYPVLDEVLRLYVEQDLGTDDIARRTSMAKDEVRALLQMVDASEHKRRQAPPGPRICERDLGGARRWPLTQGWRH